MKNILLPAVLLVSSLVPALAITDAEITPTALVGKTLVFTIVNGGAPYATTGTWSGTFAASGTAFTAKKITGDFVDITTTYTAAADGTFTNVSLPKLVEGQAAAQMTLYVDNGVGKYEAYINGVFGVSLNGTFVFGSTLVKAPEIAVQQPAGSNLVDAISKKSFGSVKIGKSGATKTFTIKNTGTAKLSGLAITKNGANKSDFSVSALTKTRLPAGGSTTFTVTFKPATKGTKNAAIHLSSSDADESPFDIKLTGKGTK